MSNLVAFSGSNLPSVASLSSALRALEADNSSTGAAILKMDRTGHWVFGAGENEVESDATWAVNPFSFVHGFIAWGEGEVLGEKMVGITQPLPELEAAPSGAKRGWETQVGMSLKCLSGDDKGLEVRYSTTSIGGKRAVQTLAVAIATQVDVDQDAPVPVIILKKEFYLHKAYGKIFTPLFDVVEWIGLGGDAKDATEEETADDSADSGRRRRSI
jgi:hypothetical protein